MELSALAVDQLFQALDSTPQKQRTGNLVHYRAPNIDIWVGDLFDLSSSALDAVDAVYDRAALVALPEAMRKRYAAHLTALTDGARQLLVTFEYDQREHAGPPFSVSEKEVRQLYGEHYRLREIARKPIEGGFRGKLEAEIETWMLERMES